jgi:hypothetical protein
MSLQCHLVLLPAAFVSGFILFLQESVVTSTGLLSNGDAMDFLLSKN